FSSRRRHTSFSRDWSSDVCSSDLEGAEATQVRERVLGGGADAASDAPVDGLRYADIPSGQVVAPVRNQVVHHQHRAAEQAIDDRSEERRVGKGAGGRWRSQLK